MKKLFFLIICIHAIAIHAMHDDKRTCEDLLELLLKLPEAINPEVPLNDKICISSVSTSKEFQQFFADELNVHSIAEFNFSQLTPKELVIICHRAKEEYKGLDTLSDMVLFSGRPTPGLPRGITPETKRYLELFRAIKRHLKPKSSYDYIQSLFLSFEFPLPSDRKLRKHIIPSQLTSEQRNQVLNDATELYSSTSKALREEQYPLMQKIYIKKLERITKITQMANITLLT